MKKFKKCFSAFFLSVFLAFGNVSGCYLEVQAFEWIVPTIGIEQALEALLLLLGVSVGVKAGQEVDWGELKDNCIQFQENQGNTAVEVGEWWEDVITGKLNQASECWSSFKAWCLSLKNTVSPDMNTIGSIASQCGITLDSEYYKNLQVHPIYVLYTSADEAVSSGSNLVIVNPVNSTDVTNITCKYQLLSGNDTIMFTNEGNVSVDIYKFTKYGVFTGKSTLSPRTGYGYRVYEDAENKIYGLPSFVGFPSYVKPWSIALNPTFAFESLLNDFSFALQNAISDAIPDVIPLPWDQLGDTTDAIENYLEGLIDAVNEGVLSLEDAMVRLQDALGVMAIDVPTGLIYPQNPDKPDETIDDKVNENQSNGGFVLSGLQKVFPFCIPFDLYAFITLLEASPVAPVIEYPIYNPVSKSNEIITIDFSTWESVVVLFRYIFDFLFIIGLLLIARALIGGGDSA